MPQDCPFLVGKGRDNQSHISAELSTELEKIDSWSQLAEGSARTWEIVMTSAIRYKKIPTVCRYIIYREPQ